MKAFIERLKERIALYDLNSLDRNVRSWLAPGKIYEFRWERLSHPEREWTVVRAIELLEAGRFLTEAEQDSLWRLVARVYEDHAIQRHYGVDRLRAPIWAEVEGDFDSFADHLRDRLRELIPDAPWFEGFLANHASS